MHFNSENTEAVEHISQIVNNIDIFPNQGKIPIIATYFLTKVYLIKMLGFLLFTFCGTPPQTMPFYSSSSSCRFYKQLGSSATGDGIPEIYYFGKHSSPRNVFNKTAFLNVNSFYIDILMYISGSRVISPWA